MPPGRRPPAPGSHLVPQGFFPGFACASPRSTRLPRGNPGSPVSLTRLFPIHSRPAGRAACSSLQATSDWFRPNQCPLAAVLPRQASSSVGSRVAPSSFRPVWFTETFIPVLSPRGSTPPKKASQHHACALSRCCPTAYSVCTLPLMVQATSEPPGRCIPHQAPLAVATRRLLNASRFCLWSMRLFRSSRPSVPATSVSPRGAKEVQGLPRLSLRDERPVQVYRLPLLLR